MESVSTLNASNADVPLITDLDGTLIRSDLMVESLCVLLKTKPWIALLVPFWMFRGKAWVKAQIARHTDLSPRRLPLNPDFKAYLDRERSLGRKIVLATASNEKFAADVSEHFEFDGYLASTDNVHLAGETKQQRIIEKFGEKGFDYAGDSERDLPVWGSARHAILVNAELRLERKLSQDINFSEILDRSNPSLMNYFKAMRVHQWLKNILIFVPLLVAHKFSDSLAVFNTLLAFFAFSFCASSVYILNDLFDLPDDRLHPNKKNRPIASGALHIKSALFMIPALLFAAIMIAMALNWKLGVVLAFYYLLTLIYSLYLKSIAMLDVQILASFYTLRVIAGAAVIEVAPSFWLLAFSMTLFLSLALAKRYTGLLVRKNAGQEAASRRGYNLSDMPILQASGLAAGYMSVVILALYVNSEDVRPLYNDPMALWMLCPAVLYWISRVWMYVHRGFMHDDPLIFAVTDKVSLLIGGLMVAVTIVAI